MSGSIISFLRSRAFRISLLMAFFTAMLLLFFLTQWLSVYTRHGEQMEVPVLIGMKKEKMEQILEEKGFKFEIIDSLFETDKKPGVILDQDPAPRTKVKEGRTIYLTVNATRPPKVKMPDLVDVSLRHAEAILESYGLKLGKTIYKPDLAKDAVLEQRYLGNKIPAGREVYKGSYIDLVLGDGAAGTDLQVPDLTGMTIREATDALQTANLVLGRTVFDGANKDSSKAVIYRQIPAAGEKNISQGESVSVYLQ